MKLIALTGRAGSGKTTIANMLCQRHGFVRQSFAGPLKSMMSTLLREAGCTPGGVEHFLNGEGKERHCEYLQGVTPRRAMQTLGTEWGRDLIGPGLWTDVMHRKLLMYGPADRVVIDDVRFENEVHLVQTHGGKVVGLEGRGGINTPHASETPVSCNMHLDTGLNSVENCRKWFEYHFNLGSPIV
jgi:hypothetical protein